ncbi:MAG: ABC transporter ATP-binding protein [Spirochaetales bacterium]|jgi:ABC-type lipoprotein export system ATPase subunit|nr:ABC transporter ATP-binding protein [Spirochaetales bacterium]
MISCENLVKIYKAGDIEVVALQGLDLVVEEGELMSIIGNSGSGKSTLMNIIGGLDKPTAGKVSVFGKDLLKFEEKDLIEYRRDTVGFVWQNNARNLIPYLSALENVEVPMTVAKVPNRRAKAKETLDMVGLSHRLRSKTTELSGGEQQRVAIAIALANSPKLLLADEPTGNIDTKAANTVFKVFREINRELGVTIVIVTHDRRIASAVDRFVAIRDGRTSSEFVRRRVYTDQFQELAIHPEDDESHEELAVIDKTGRLQIPKEYLEAAGLLGKKTGRVEMDGNKIVIVAPDDETE